MDRVGVVVLNYKGIQDTLSCFDSLLAQSYDALHIIIVENGSNDGSAERLKQLQTNHPDLLTVLYNKENLGFAGGVNTGITWCMEQRYTHVALFNNDAIADKDWLTNLTSSAVANKSDITTSLLLLGDGKTIDSTGDYYSTWGMPFPRQRGIAADQAPKSEPVFSGSGGASLYSVAMLRSIGLFDEVFFAYYEDLDISFRAQLAGYKVYYESTAVAYHKQGSTSSRMPGFTVYQTFKNLPLVFIKNVPAQLLFPIGCRFYLAYWLIYANAVAHGNGIPATKGLLASGWYGIKALSQRHVIQQHSVLPVSSLRAMLYADIPPDQTGLRKFRQIFTRKS